MKIAINLLPYKSYQGTETFIVNLVKALIKEAINDRIILIKHNQSPDWLNFEDKSVENAIVRLPNTSNSFLEFYQQTWFYKKISVDIKPDILFTPSPHAPLFYTNTYITIHDCAYDRFPEFASLASKIYFKLMFWKAKWLSKGVITISNFSKKEIANVYKIKPEKIHVVSEGPPKLPEVDDEFVNKTKGKFGTNNPYVFYVGITRPRKNIEGMLKAFKKFSNKNPDYKFVLAGKVDKRFIDVEKMIKQLELEEKVIQAGFVSDQEKVALYKNSDALVFTSFYEGFGLPILEAQSLGVPILTSNTSSLPEIVGKGALFVNPYDIDEMAKGLEKIVHNNQLRNNLIAEGLENVKRFSWNKSAKKLLKVIRGKNHA